MPLVVIHGPGASGKTFHADKFKAHYGLETAADWYSPKRFALPRAPEADLLLTQESAEVVGRAFPEATIVHINDARRAIGLDDAPANGFRAQPWHGIIVAREFIALGYKLPFSYEGDGQIVDAEDRPVCVIDPHGELPNNSADDLAALIVHACNFFDPMVR